MQSQLKIVSFAQVCGRDHLGHNSHHSWILHHTTGYYAITKISWKIFIFLQGRLKVWPVCQDFSDYVTSETKRNQNQHGEVICYTHTHHTCIWHIALFDCLYLDPKANPKFLNFKDLSTHLQELSNKFNPKYSTCKNVGAVQVRR